MALDATQLMLIEQRVTNDGPSTGVAYLLWFFLGLLGAHRFYLGRTGSAVAQLLISLFLGWIIIGLVINGVWLIVDAFLIPDMLRQKRDALRQKLTMEMMVTGGPPVAGAPAPAQAASAFASPPIVS
ncbi:MAG TPA: TM2 domain-containing protein [Caulobacteraceae bacterium]|jgi:TM2 domain-containing membrane protein YozV